MTVYKIVPLNVAGETVSIVRALGSIYVPGRALVEGILEMGWPGQREKLDRLAKRLDIRTLTVEYSSGKFVTQPCIPAAVTSEFLWTLRPGKDAPRQRLAHLQTHWRRALAKFMGADPDLATEAIEAIARANTEASDAKVKLAALQNCQATQGANPIVQRHGKPLLGAADFEKMVTLAREGLPKSEIAKHLGCSRTAVVLFLDGKYTSGAGKLAYADLCARGLLPIAAQPAAASMPCA